MASRSVIVPPLGGLAGQDSFSMYSMLALSAPWTDIGGRRTCSFSVYIGIDAGAICASDRSRIDAPVLDRTNLLFAVSRSPTHRSHSDRHLQRRTCGRLACNRGGIYR